jgi:hypothetical protein
MNAIITLIAIAFVAWLLITLATAAIRVLLRVIAFAFGLLLTGSAVCIVWQFLTHLASHAG